LLDDADEAAMADDLSNFIAKDELDAEDVCGANTLKPDRWGRSQQEGGGVGACGCGVRPLGGGSSGGGIKALQEMGQPMQGPGSVVLPSTCHQEASLHQQLHRRMLCRVLSAERCEIPQSRHSC
jgi:hypothetical protein